MTINMNHQETKTITKVTESGDWFSLSFEDSTILGLKKKHGVVPKVGDVLTIHTKGVFFGTVRGMDLNGKRVFYKTEEELEASRQKWNREYEEQKQREFEQSRERMDAQFLALPPAFQKRISRFRTNNPKFRVDYEQYELFCCEQAVLIANALESPDDVQEFRKLAWDDQMKKVPGLSDGHSGNTFGCACSLAYWYLSNPENVVKLHGALSPLVGSEKYGDLLKSEN